MAIFDNDRHLGFVHPVRKKDGTVDEMYVDIGAYGIPLKANFDSTTALPLLEHSIWIIKATRRSMQKNAKPGRFQNDVRPYRLWQTSGTVAVLFTSFRRGLRQKLVERKSLPCRDEKTGKLIIVRIDSNIS
jgi:hypothetical protein